MEGVRKTPHRFVTEWFKLISGAGWHKTKSGGSGAPGWRARGGAHRTAAQRLAVAGTRATLEFPLPTSSAVRWTPAGYLFLAIAVAAPGAALAQYPRSERGRFEVRGLDFRPDGAWRGRTAAVRSARRSLLRSGSLSALNARAPGFSSGRQVTGAIKVPVVPVAFSNVGPSATPASIESILFAAAPAAGRPYSLKTFYEQVSNGRITLDGRVLPWVTAPQTDLYYEDDCNGVGVRKSCPNGGRRLGELLLFALQSVSNGADAATVWGPYDNDGPDGIPNSGDDDGVVDFVTFLQPEVDGACGTANIWAHRFVVSAFNGGSRFVTKTPRTGAPGEFLTVDDYTLQSAVGGASACDGSQLLPIGTIAHETGHAFGLPDLYDTGNSTEGIGEWGLMGSGNYATPHSPSRFEAWSLAELGWVTVEPLTTTRTVRTGPVTASDTVFYVAVSGTDEYFLIENRQDLESDAAQMDPALPTNPAFGPRRKLPGLLVWHIDQGQIDAQGFHGSNRVNVGNVHGVALIQADGRNDLRSPGAFNRGDDGDSYPGALGNRRLSMHAVPALRDNQGAFTGFRIDSVHQVAPQGEMVFRFIAGPATVITAEPADGARVRVDDIVLARWEDVLLPGEQVTVSADPIQVIPGNLSRFTFQRWSNGQPRDHVLTSTGTPETIRAEFAIEHRILVQLTGAQPGAVTAAATPALSVPELSAGVFRPAGTAVTLSAVAPEGLVFGGWSGDTTSLDPTLVLPMQRPYAVRATFVASAAVTADVAAEALLGGAALHPTAQAYLDGNGNRNGRYDLGDFLALVARGAEPSAGVMQRVLAEKERKR